MTTPNRPESKVPLIVAIAILLLPVAYFGSYVALVVPDGIAKQEYYCRFEKQNKTTYASYRLQDESAHRLFWYLERIDRRLRPVAWERKDEPLSLEF